jgi:2-polyprenyl-6-hydroxyphenyl methylase/3-demethylubiquinone-9 3-methyltransferase
MSDHQTAHRDAASFHDALADAWENKYSQPTFVARRKIFVELLETCAPGGVWLDVGCGTGTLARVLAERGSAVLAFDPAPKMLQRGRLLHANNVAFVRIATAEELPIRGSSVDGIVCSSVLEYTEDPRRCLLEFHRVLKPSGVLLVSIPNAHSWLRMALRTAYTLTSAVGRPWPAWLKHSRYQYSEGNFRQLLLDVGLLARHVIHFGGGKGLAGCCGGSLMVFKAEPVR